jgi:hypothetical protein
MKEREKHARFWSQILKESDRLGDVGIDMQKNLILEKYATKVGL